MVKRKKPSDEILVSFLPRLGIVLITCNFKSHHLQWLPELGHLIQYYKMHYNSVSPTSYNLKISPNQGLCFLPKTTLDICKMIRLKISPNVMGGGFPFITPTGCRESPPSPHAVRNSFFLYIKHAIPNFCSNNFLFWIDFAEKQSLQKIAVLK